MTSSEDFGRRRLLTVAARDEDPDFERGLDDQVAVLTTWLTDATLGGRKFARKRLLPKRPDEIKDFVAREVRGTEADDVVVVYVTGHGIQGASGNHYLVLSESDKDAPLTTCYRTSDLLSAVLGSEALDVLIIVDSCHAGALDDEWAKLGCDLPKERRKLATLAVITAADFDEKPKVGQFAELLELVYQRLQPHGPAEITGPYLTIVELLTEIGSVREEHRAPGKPMDLDPILIWPLMGSDFFRAPGTPCLPNPGYIPPVDLVDPSVRQVAFSQADLDYWIRRASGRIADNDAGWYFSGRADIMRDVVGFLLSGNGIQVITGVAGSGKSAVLARAVTLSDVRFRNDNPELLAGIDASVLPPQGGIGAAVLAREKDTGQICAELLDLLGGHPSGAGNGVEQLADHLAQAGRPVTVVVDGVDEATYPDRLITDVLAPMARIVDDDGAPLVRLLLGMRSEEGDPAPEDRGRGLLELLGRAAGETPLNVVRTDDTPAVTADIGAYLAALLDVEGSPYAGDITADDPVATFVAEKVSPSFLDARLAGDRLRSASHQQDLTDRAWLGTLADGTLSLFRADLTETAAAIGWPAWQVLAVLRATAFAIGRGLPWGDVWPAAAQAVCDQPIENIADDVIEAVLGSRLAGYLAGDVEDGRVVRRPNHERLAEELRDTAAALLDGEGPQVDDDSVAVQRRITTALASLVDPTGLTPPHPYVARHLIDHAQRGGVLDDTHVPAAVLPWEPAGRVRGLLGIPPPPGRSAGHLAAWARIEPFLGDAPLASRRMSLVFACASVGLPLAKADNGHDPLAPAWARWTLAPGNVVAARARGESATRVEALTWLSLPGDQQRVLLASGGADGMVRLWDPFTATGVGEPLDGHGGESVDALATLMLPDGRVLLASGGYDGMVRLWDPRTATAVGDPLDCRNHDAVTALAELRLPDGSVLLAIGSRDGTVRLWEPPTSEPRSPARDLLVGANDGAVWALAELRMPDGSVLLASGGGGNEMMPRKDRLVRLWDPVTLTLADTLPVGSLGDGVLALAELRLPDGSVRLACGSQLTFEFPVTGGGAVWLWGPLLVDGHQRLTRIEMRTHPILLDVLRWPVVALAEVRLADGSVLLASGGGDGVVRLWDPLIATSAGELSGHFGQVCSLAALRSPDGSVSGLLASGGADGTVRLWNPRDDIREGQFDAHGGGPVLALAELRLPDGSVLVASGGEDGVVRLWDPLNGTLAGELTGQAGPVYALAQLRSPDGSVLLAASGGANYTMWLWDPLTKNPVVESFLAGHAAPVLALAEVELPDGSVLLASGSRDGALFLTTGGQDTMGVVLSHPDHEFGKAHRASVIALTELRFPDGSVLLASAGSDGVVRLWDPRKRPWDPLTEALIGTLGHGKNEPYDGEPVDALAALRFPDETVLLAVGGRDGVVRLWDPLTTALAGEIGHISGEAVTALAELRFPDGSVLLASGGAHGTLRLWDSKDGTEIARIATGRRIRALRTICSGHRRHIIVGGDGGIACLTVRFPISEQMAKPSPPSGSVE